MLSLSVKTALVIWILLPCRMLPQQSRFDTGEFKGFTKSPGEHIINRHETPVRTALFKGSVVDPVGGPIPGAIVEVRGPGQNETVNGALTDKRGRFKLGHLHRGSYAFKITSNGFQSVVGQLEIAPGAGRNQPVKIVLQVGV